MKAIVLISGGMDSCVVTAIAKTDGYDLASIHVNYGQRTEKRELLAYNEIADYYDIRDRLVLDISHLYDIGGSCLTDENLRVPDADFKNAEIPISYVPFRNANILSAAVSWAEVLKVNIIYVGAVEEDSSGYPDCRRLFFDAFEKTIEAGTKPETHVKIITPLIELSKKYIVQKGVELNAPFHLTWSCYANEDRPCSKCDSCVLRTRGFKQAGIPDPLFK